MDKKIIETIPQEILAEVRYKKIILMGFGAGPGCVGQLTERLHPPASFSQGMAWLERYRRTFRRAPRIPEWWPPLVQWALF